MLLLTLAAFASVAVWIVLRRHWTPEQRRSSMFCGSVVILSSLHHVMTKPPVTFDFRIHLAMLLVFTPVCLAHAIRLRRA